MASRECNLYLIKVIMLCCDCCHTTHCYAPYRCYTVEHTCTTEAPQPPACHPCYMRPHATPNCNPAILHEVPQHSIGATLTHITQKSAQLLKVVHPASAAALQQLGCVNKSDAGLLQKTASSGLICWSRFWSQWFFLVLVLCLFAGCAVCFASCRH